LTNYVAQATVENAARIAIHLGIELVEVEVCSFIVLDQVNLEFILGWTCFESTK
jgi:hypothetical protein